MTEIAFATPLRRFVADSPAAHARGETLRDIITAINADHPQFGAAVLREGQLVPYVHALIDGQPAEDLGGMDAPTATAAQIRFLTAVAGG